MHKTMHNNSVVMVMKSDVNRLGIGFLDVSHVGSRLAGLEGGVASIGLGQWQLSFTCWEVCIGAWLSCGDGISFISRSVPELSQLYTQK